MACKGAVLPTVKKESIELSPDGRADMTDPDAHEAHWLRDFTGCKSREWAIQHSAAPAGSASPGNLIKILGCIGFVEIHQARVQQPGPTAGSVVLRGDRQTHV